MNKAMKFKAAHKLAKAYKIKMQGGDYLVYFSHALKLVNLGVQKIKGIQGGENKLLNGMNNAISNIAENAGVKADLITKKRKVYYHHGRESFSHQYKKDKREQQLPKGQFFGVQWVKDRVIYANVRSVGYEDEAY